MRWRQLNALCVAFQTGPESQRLQEISWRVILVMRVDQTLDWFIAVDQRAGDVKSRQAPGPSYCRLTRQSGQVEVRLDKEANLVAQSGLNGHATLCFATASAKKVSVPKFPDFKVSAMS